MRTRLALALVAIIALATGCRGDLSPTAQAPTVETSQPPAPEPAAAEPQNETAEPEDETAEDRPRGDREQGVVRFVPDGDTIELRDGRTIRFVQIDAPEQYPPDREECYGDEARETLRSILESGDTVELERDPRLDDQDRFGRYLRYVYVDGKNVNLVLVRVGAAAPYFFDGQRGRFAERLLAAAEQALDEGRGLWGACPEADLNPRRNVATGPPGS